MLMNKKVIVRETGSDWISDIREVMEYLTTTLDYVLYICGAIATMLEEE